MPQLTYNIVPPVAANEGQIASMMEGTIIVPFLAEGVVPVGLLAAPGTRSMSGPPLTTLSQYSTSPGQVKALPAGLVTDPMADTSWVGIPIYDATREPYDTTLGYSSYADKSTVPVLRRGPVWVKPEGSVSPGVAVYVRTAASGGNTILGKFAGAAGTGLVAFSKARWLTGLIQSEWAQLYFEF